ncbi:MAG: transposase [Candidatus Zixiibacteriota bacterium]
MELARIAVNKTMVQERKGRGRKGYGRLAALRLLVYAMLVGITNDEPLEKHLRKKPGIAKALGFKKGIPDRTSIGRWKRKHDAVAREAFERQASVIGTMVRSKLLVVDSTPLEDWRDPEAEWGYYSRGPFKGFKVHVAVDQLGLPRRAILTAGNMYDSPLLPELIAGQKTRFVLGDAAYDAGSNKEACREIGAKPCFARNKRRHGKRRYTPTLPKRKRYVVEQFNSRFKETLGGCWLWFKGLAKKATVVYSALMAMNALALQALLTDEPVPLLKVGVYRY